MKTTYSLLKLNAALFEGLQLDTLFLACHLKGQPGQQGRIEKRQTRQVDILQPVFIAQGNRECFVEFGRDFGPEDEMGSNSLSNLE